MSPLLDTTNYRCPYFILANRSSVTPLPNLQQHTSDDELLELLYPATPTPPPSETNPLTAENIACLEEIFYRDARFAEAGRIAPQTA